MAQSFAALIYDVITYSINQRAREIGIRLPVGASAGLSELR